MTITAVYTPHAELQATALALAEQLHLPYQAEADYLLILTPHYLGLQKTAAPSLPLYIDLASGKMNYRRQHLSLRREILARALGLKKHTQPIIVDATAGLARDSFMIAALGFSVQLIERSPLIYALLKDGFQRGLKNPVIAPIIQRMQLIQEDATLWLQKTSIKPDIIYLDPMFPERKKSALSKKDMQIFQAVVGNDLDADALLKTALTCATQRVVVKRPRLADALAGLSPSFSLCGSSSRFDIYLL